METEYYWTFGGKDSLALVDLLGRRQKIFRPKFEVVVAHIIMKNIPYMQISTTCVDVLRNIIYPL
jgi:hypothetical protein